MEQTRNLLPIQINGNFSTIEFRYVIKRSGTYLTKFTDWCNQSQELPHSYSWFFNRFGNRNRHFSPNKVVEPILAQALSKFMGLDNFIFLRKNFAEAADLPFPPQDIQPVKSTLNFDYMRFMGLI